MIRPSSGIPKSSADIPLKNKTEVGKKGSGAYSSDSKSSAADKFTTLFDENNMSGGFKGAVGGRGGKNSSQNGDLFSEMFSLNGANKTTETEKAQGAKGADAAGKQPPNESSVVNGVNIDSLGAMVKEPVDYPGYEKTEYGYIQTDPSQPGADYLLLVPDSTKMTNQQKHYMRNIEMAKLIRNGTIPTHLETFKKKHAGSYKLLPEGKSRYHMNGENGGYNIKLVNSEKIGKYESGQLEVVYSTVSGKLDLSPENMPTLNHAGPDNFMEHYDKDVKPYAEYGNTPHDKTGWLGKKTGPIYIDQSDKDKKAEYDKTREDFGEVRQEPEIDEEEGGLYP